MILSQAEREQILTESQSHHQKNHLPPRLLELLYRHRLFKLFIPDEFGGRMTPVPKVAKIIEECAALDGSLGWLVNIGAGGGYFIGYLPEELAAELAASKEFVIAGSGFPSGKAQKTQGGYRLNGTWKYCSGAEHASHFTVAAELLDAKGNSIGKRAFLLQPEQVEVLHDWNAYGLEATGSHSIAVKDAIVPEELMFDLMQPPVRPEPIYAYPFVPFALVCFGAVVSGITKHYLAETKRLAEQHYGDWQQANNDRGRFFHQLLSEQQQEVEQATQAFHQATERSWQAHLEQTDELQQAHEALTTAARAMNRTCFEAATHLFYFSGMEAVMQDTLLNKLFRDLTTASQHVLLKEFK